MKNNLCAISLFSFLIFIGCTSSSKNEQLEKSATPKVILITLDGVRWQELFTGADSLLIADKEYVKNTTRLKEKFWRKSAEERRKVLFPFFWSKIADKGALYGNRSYNNYVNLENKHWFSYPGYSEILCGFADDVRINSNDKFNNPNISVLEHINNTKLYKGKVAAFGSWDVFPYILNEKRSKIPVNAGFDLAKGNDLTEVEKSLNKLQEETPSPWHNVRLDAFTHHYALEHLKKHHPNLTFISYGETDDFAHDGEYDAYLNAIKRADNFIKQLWDFTQKDPFYKDKTTFIITTDHGRGTEPISDWRHHGNTIKKAGEIWLATLGANTEIKGEARDNMQLYSSQIAATIAEIMQVKVISSKLNTKVLPIIEKENRK